MAAWHATFIRHIRLLITGPFKLKTPSAYKHIDAPLPLLTHVSTHGHSHISLQQKKVIPHAHAHQKTQKQFEASYFSSIGF